MKKPGINETAETIQDSCNGNPQLNKFYDNANIDIKECEVTKETVMNAIDNGFLHEQGVAVQRPNIRYVNYPRPKGRELLVFASTEPLVLTQQDWIA